MLFAGFLFLRTKHAAYDRLHAKHREEAGGDPQSENPYRIAVAGQIHAIGLEGGHARKRAAEAPVIQEIEGRMNPT